MLEETPTLGELIAFMDQNIWFVILVVALLVACFHILSGPNDKGKGGGGCSGGCGSCGGGE